jgi:hypothetical protein
VHTLALVHSGAALIVGGEFSSLGGTAAGRLARFSPTGVFDATVNGSLGSGFNADVLSLLPSGSDLFVGGSFTALNGVARSRLVKLNVGIANGSNAIVDPSFVTETSGGFDNDVHALAFMGPAKILVGGKFANYRSAAAPGLISLFTANGERDRGFNFAAGFSPSTVAPVEINALAVTDQGAGAYSVYAGGEFSKFKGYVSPRLVKMNQSGIRDAGFVIGPQGFDGSVHAILATPNGIFVGGDFQQYKGAAVSGLVRLNSASAALEASVTLTGGGVRTLASAEGGNVWAGGSFAPVGSQTAAAVIQLNSDLVIESSFNVDLGLGAHTPEEFNSFLLGTRTNADVYGVHALSYNPTAPSRLFVGGFFSLLNNAVAAHGVRLTTQGIQASNP